MNLPSLLLRVVAQTAMLEPYRTSAVLMPHRYSRRAELYAHHAREQSWCGLRSPIYHVRDEAQFRTWIAAFHGLDQHAASVRWEYLFEFYDNHLLTLDVLTSENEIE